MDEKSFKVSGYPVTQLRVGRHTLGHVTISDDVSVVFRMADDDAGPQGPSGECTVCKISKIRECADEVCPPIKAQDPNASCADAIGDCAARKCAAECTGGSIFGGDILIIA